MKLKLFCFVIFLFASASLIAQVDNSQLKTTEKYPTKFIPPKAYTTQSYGLDAVISVGPFDNYQVSGTAGFCETDINVNVRNPLNFVATDNRITGFVGTPFIFFTTDGGVTWGNTSIPGNQGDPVFASDSLGNFYLAVLNNGVQIYKSTNGGLNWTNLGLIVSNANADKEWIAADQTNGTYKNHVYMAYVNFATGASVDVWRSTNNGTNWSFIANVGTGTPNPGPCVTTAPNGDVYVSWYNGGGTSFVKSTNGGANFSSPVFASFHSFPGNVNGSGRYVLKTDIRVNGNSNLAVDMTNGPRRGYIYNVYAANPPGPDNADIFFTRSTDGGATWSSSDPIRVNNDATFYDQWMCDCTVDNQGRLWAYWWDSRNDSITPNLLTETWGAVSTDGGTNWTNFKISNQNFNPSSVKIFQGANHYYLGDYQQMSGKNFVLPFYCAQNNNLNDFTAYLPDWGTSFSKTIDTVLLGNNSTVLMRNPVMGPYSGTVTYTSSITPSPSPGTINVTFNPGNVRTFTGNADSITINALVSANVPAGVYTVKITGTESGGPRTHERTYQILATNSIGIQTINSEIPTAFTLEQNYPNPFNPVTNIKFGLPKGSFVTLKVYDVLGKEVASLINNRNLQAGNYVYDFNAANIPSGVYFYKLITADFTDVKKMMLIK